MTRTKVERVMNAKKRTSLKKRKQKEALEGDTRGVPREAEESKENEKAEEEDKCATHVKRTEKTRSATSSITKEGNNKAQSGMTS